MTRQALLEEAARARRDATAAPSDRPRQRRSAETAGSQPLVRSRAQIQLRAASDGDTVEFDGIASAYEQPYEMYDYWGPYTEIVTAGAGAESLARTNLDVPLVLQHESLRRIARTTNGSLILEELDEGLRTNAPALDMRDADVAYIVPKMRAGLIDEMSFRFSITRGHWSPDYTEYRIDEYDIHRGDVAIVGYGANPFTSAELRADAGGITWSDLTPDQLRSHEQALRAELARRQPAPAPSMTKRRLDLIDAQLDL